MQTSPYTNIAFISYKREDEEWAKWLQKMLEHYKLPTEIRKQNPDLEFAKNPRHVFKDTTDLSGGVLAKAIKEGLDSSKFLIVICSPRATKSEWVCKEVQDLIDSGREEYIIPFIIDGEPYAKNPEDECFPEALKSLAGERELLGININENGRESAAVKVIARMFSLKFDTLWNRFQREEKKKRRRIIGMFIAAILFLLCVIAGGAYAYFEIQKERDKAELETKRANEEKERAKQLNKQLFSANDSISKQKTSLQKAYDDLTKTEQSLAKSNSDLSVKNAQLEEEKKNVLKANWHMMENQSRAVAEKARQKIADGEVYDAILALLKVLPDNKEKPSRPFVPEAEQTLRIALDSLKSCTYVKYQISHDSYCDFSYGGKYLLYDTDNGYSIKDSETYEDKWDLSLDCKVNYIACSDNDKYLEVGIDDKLLVYDFESGELCETLLVGDNTFSVMMQDSHPFYIYKGIDFDEYSPNILTQWFELESNRQVVDYLPTRKLILCKTVNSIEDSCIDQIQTYSLYNISDNKILWQQTDSVSIPEDINSVSISNNGKYVIISRWHVIDLVDINTGKKETINIFDAGGHYTNDAFVSRNDKYLFQCCELDKYAHIYDLGTRTCIDSLQTYPLFPKRISYYPNNSKYIINYFDWVTTNQKSYMFVKPSKMMDKPKDILPLLIKEDSNKTCHTDEEGNLLKYTNNKGVSWSTENATFIGFTADMQYVIVRKLGYRGVDVYEVLDINTGLSMYTEYIGVENDHINFLLYPDLLETSKKIIKHHKLSESQKREFYL